MLPWSHRTVRGAVGCAALVSLALAGCGQRGERAVGVYDPRVPVVSCLRDEGVPARRVDGIAVQAGRVRVEFLITPGEAEARQIAGRAQSSEQIGRALIHTRGASEELLETVEGCVDDAA